MIKYETIISNFDDKTTLYNWLRKVEEALKNASATNFVVNKKGNATLSFSITFADGTTLESGDIVLQQGESVDGARIASGVLQLHLTNGTWLTAGNLGAVSGFSINGSQHLIVTYQDGTSQDLGAIFNGNISISGNITATGTISGASGSFTNLQGTAITGDSIIENMSGYSFAEDTSSADFETDPVYAGIVKNGNKLTLVYATNITRKESSGSSHSLAYFYVPNAVKDKLYPTTIGGYSALSFMKVYAVTSNNQFIPINVLIIKGGVVPIIVQLQGNTFNDLPLDEAVYLRVEQTFLLSDNLAQ